MLNLALSGFVDLVEGCFQLMVRLIQQLLITLPLIVMHRTTHCYLLLRTPIIPIIPLLPSLLKGSSKRRHLPPLHHLHSHPQPSLPPSVLPKHPTQAKPPHFPQSSLIAHSPQPKHVPPPLTNW